MKVFTLILASLQLSPLRVTSDDAARVEATTVERGVQARIGSLADDWQVFVEPDAEGVVVEARAPSGTSTRQSVALDGDDATARGIAVASVVALIIEQHDPDVVETSSPPSSESSTPSHVRGSIEVRGGVQSNVHRDAALTGTLDLGGGAWLLREHLRVEAAASWQHRRANELAVHGVTLRAGLLGGARLRGPDGRVWLGAGASIGPSWNIAVDTERASQVAAVLELPAALAVDLSPRWLLTARAGASVLLPPLRFIGDQGTLRWRTVRPFVAVGFGIRLP